MDHPFAKAAMTYDQSHSLAYAVLRRVEQKIAGRKTGGLLGLVKWEWHERPDQRCTELVVIIRAQRISIMRSQLDMMQRDAFDTEWIEEAAEEISAWMLLMDGVRKESA